MEKKDIFKLGIIYILVFLLALFSDIGKGQLDNPVIVRDKVGGNTTKVDLLLDVGDAVKDYEVLLEIEPTQITQEEAEVYFSNAIKQIDTEFKEISRKVPMKENYEQIVEADWSFSPAGMIESDGDIHFEKVAEDGTILMANVLLECGSYERVYSFPFKIYPPDWTESERIQQELDSYIAEQQKKEGVEEFYLPKELNGLPATWKEEKEYISIKILLLEVMSFVLLIYAKKKEKESLMQKQRYKRELQYPEIVNQLLILMEAGMTTRQAWHRIAYQYSEKRKKALIEDSEVYAAIVQMDRKLADGENERSAYESLVTQMDSMCYRRLMRLLINNLQKGNKDICQQLGIEAKQAYEQRILLAKKLGEEASTKMLIPMMLMMLVVMAIIMAPAMMGFAV